MTREEFVKVIREEVLEGSISAMKSVLLSPPGRRPDKDVLEMSKWYLNLKGEERAIVDNLIRKLARDTVFGFLCVLDGATAIEKEDKGALKLFYKKGNYEVLLNDEHATPLHEFVYD